VCRWSSTAVINVMDNPVRMPAPLVATPDVPSAVVAHVVAALVLTGLMHRYQDRVAPLTPFAVLDL
jgi:hypothetical protein